MASSKNVISSAAEECIRRFTEEMLHISAWEKQVETPKHPSNGPPMSPHVEHRATQTDPVMITIPNGTANGTVNGHTNGHTNGREQSVSCSPPSSQPLPLPAQDGSVSDHANKKSVLDSVLLQSPKASGVLAPPSTPEYRPRLTNNEISQIIIEKIEGLPPSSTLTLSESRHAPRHSSPFVAHEPSMRAFGTKEYTSSMPAKQMSQADRATRDGSFPRMSFQVADSSPATPRSSSALEPIPSADSSAAATTKSSPASVSSKALDSPLPEAKWVPPHLRGLEKMVSKAVSSTATTAFPRPEVEASKGKGAIEGNPTGRLNIKPTHRVSTAKTRSGPPSEDTATTPATTPPPATFQAVSPPAPLPEDTISGASGTTSPTATFQATSTPAPLLENTTSSASAVTPSSVIFQAVSPQMPSTADFRTKENREKELFFKAWGKPEARSTAAAKVRKVIIDLPNHPAPTPSLVASLVWGGPVEEIHMKPNSAQVLFAYPENCDAYYDATANGIDYKNNGRDLVAFVNKGKDVDVVSGNLNSYLEQGFTRCVRAIDAPPSFTTQELRAKAELKNRKVEGIEKGMTKEGLPYVIFRFCNIAHAVAFKLALTRDEEWEHCNIHYVPDPCAQATGVHFGN